MNPFFGNAADLFRHNHEESQRRAEAEADAPVYRPSLLEIDQRRRVLAQQAAANEADSAARIREQANWRVPGADAPRYTTSDQAAAAVRELDAERTRVSQRVHETRETLDAAVRAARALAERALQPGYLPPGTDAEELALTRRQDRLTSMIENARSTLEDLRQEGARLDVLLADARAELSRLHAEEVAASRQAADDHHRSLVREAREEEIARAQLAAQHAQALTAAGLGDDDEQEALYRRLRDGRP